MSTITESSVRTPNAMVTPAISLSAPTIDTPRKKGFGLLFWFFVVWLGVVLIWAVFGKHLPFAHRGSDYQTAGLINDGKWLKTFSWKHPLGTDQNGNDWLSASVTGARNSMIIAFATIMFGFFVGGGLGMIAGYRKGKIDSVLTFFTTVLLSFPPLLFILIILTIFAARVKSSGIAEGLQTSVWKLSFTLGILSIPTLYRVVRAATMQYASREFVTAARAMGAKPGRIIMRELLPNVFKPMIAYGLVAAGNVMVIEGGLSYLGIGVGESWAWGKMIAEGSSGVFLKRAPHVSFIPILVLFLTVLSFNFIGDKLRERLEVKQAGI
jgi:peptide/nickel transport system permease protein